MSKKRLIVDYDKYFLMINDAYLDYDGEESVEMGKVVDTHTGKDIIYVYYNKNNYKENGYHINLNVYENDTGEYAVANISDIHRPCLYKDPDVFLSMALHEYGHYVNGDLNRPGITTEQIQRERVQALLNGRVYDMERRADNFAVRYVGKHTILRSFDYLIEQRIQRGDDLTSLAVREFELRKKAIRNL